ncbi:Gfo/Idh/MocA family protein [Cecembia calidifontis]|uniref:Putative dehydrogenase n=1 Tax=Cecembia calidifontis TaxID=1187080 RepID=A0A4Q7PBS8_9BACT|nr:Gfo/Idh/MocA family oxidoreductase [Cecembia calidifontis]RZS97665.1 putative dehydrogenase [Cecembia calidifontis]
MKRKIGIGIIGTGAITGTHIQAIQSLENAHLVGLLGFSEQVAQSAESQFGVKVFYDIREFLAMPDLDLVSICTASGNHLESALAAIQAGKHVLIEKPIEINLDRADQIIKASEQNGLKCGVIFQNRFSPDFLRLKAAVNAGKFGKLLMGNAHINWYRSPEYYSSSSWKGTLSGDGGGAFINQGIHTIDLLLNILGPVEMVFGKVKTLLHRIEGEDIGAAIVHFKNGALGNISASTALFPGYPERLEIFGSLGSAVLEAGKLKAWNIQGEETSLEVGKANLNTGAADPLAIGYKLHLEQYKDMVKAILEDRNPLVDGHEARKSLELILGIYESSKSKLPVWF